MINPHFHEIAVKLVNDLLNDSDFSEKEGDMVYRTAMNRLYYSVFHNITLFFHIQFSVTDERAIHSALQNKLIDQDHDAIASILEEMRLLRVDVDYHLNIPATSGRYHKMITFHDTIVELMENNTSG